MKTHTLLWLLAFGCLPLCPAGAATTVVEKSAVAIAQITTTQVILPAGAPGYYPALVVGGDTSAGGSPSRLLFEFSLAGIARASDVQDAKFSAIAFGGSRAMGTLSYALFGYAGTGMRRCHEKVSEKKSKIVVDGVSSRCRIAAVTPEFPCGIRENTPTNP